MQADAMSEGESRKLDHKYLTSFVVLKEPRESLAAQEAPDGKVQAASDSDQQSSDGDTRGVCGTVRAVWAKSLNLSPQAPDLTENFYDLGSHSALVTRIVAELSTDYGLTVCALDIYSHSTLVELRDFVDSAGSKDSVVVEKRRRMPRGRSQGADSIADVGLAGRFPGADDGDQLWENLRKCAVSATFLSRDFLRKKGLGPDVVDNEDYVPCAYMLNDADKFDRRVFGVGRHKTFPIDLQQRLFLKTGRAALENGALKSKDALSNVVVGVFCRGDIDGCMIHHLVGNPLKATMDPRDMLLRELGSEKDHIATLVF